MIERGLMVKWGGEAAKGSESRTLFVPRATLENDFMIQVSPDPPLVQSVTTLVSLFTLCHEQRNRSGHSESLSRLDCLPY